MAISRSCGKGRERLEKVFNAWRATYHAETKRNPYAYQSFKKGYELGLKVINEEVNTRLNEKMADITIRERRLEDYTNLMIEGMHLLKKLHESTLDESDTVRIKYVVDMYKRFNQKGIR